MAANNPGTIAGADLLTGGGATGKGDLQNRPALFIEDGAKGPGETL
jgi:hypothetical protein